MDEKMEIGSGNVFADLGHPDADIKLAKVDLAIRIGRIIEGKHWTATAAAEALGTDQSKVSKILNGQLKEFSLERLVTYFMKLGWSLELRAKPARGTGSLSVTGGPASAAQASAAKQEERRRIVRRVTAKTAGARRGISLKNTKARA